MNKKLFLLFMFAAFALVGADAAKVVKILAIGNSFSEDAIEQNLHEIAAADGVETIIGNLYIPGCSLEHHMKCVNEDAKAYRYRKIGVDGKMVEINKEQVSKALADEDWDFVSVQQASHFSGVYYTYQPYLSELIAYVKKHVSPKTKIVFHQTWAYSQDSKHDGFIKYGKDQMTMFKGILDATRSALRDCPVDVLVPAGTAIQNARTSFIGDRMNRDGYHLNLTYGRYTAACTWYQAIFKKSVVGNQFMPKGVTEEERVVAQKAAKAAVKHPFDVTNIR